MFTVARKIFSETLEFAKGMTVFRFLFEGVI